MYAVDNLTWKNLETKYLNLVSGRESFVHL